MSSTSTGSSSSPTSYTVTDVKICLSDLRSALYKLRTLSELMEADDTTVATSIDKLDAVVAKATQARAELGYRIKECHHMMQDLEQRGRGTTTAAGAGAGAGPVAGVAGIGLSSMENLRQQVNNAEIQVAQMLNRSVECETRARKMWIAANTTNGSATTPTQTATEETKIQRDSDKIQQDANVVVQMDLDQPTQPTINQKYHEYTPLIQKQAIQNKAALDQELAMEREALSNDRFLQERDQAVRQIQASIYQVQDIFKDLGQLVELQAPRVEKVAENFDKSEVYTQQAVEEQHRTIAAAKDRRGFFYAALIITAIIIAFIILMVIF